MLTRKNVKFHWDEDYPLIAFEALKRKLVEAPVLFYPSFTKDFMLETDASIEGLGAVLSQMQQNGCQHPISFASRALYYRPGKKNKNANELSCSPHEPAPLAIAEDDGEVQISLISESFEQTMESLLEAQLPWGRNRGKRKDHRFSGEGRSTIRPAMCSASSNARTVMKILEQCQKWNRVPILSCKIWRGQENNGMATTVA